MPHNHAVLYFRPLPGGGFVAIEGEPASDGISSRGMICIERRSDPDRRDGHEPPVVLQADGVERGEVFDRLVSIANSNVEVAAALLRWQAMHGHAHPDMGTAPRLSAPAGETRSDPPPGDDIARAS